MSSSSGIRVLGPLLPGFDQILTREALGFLEELHRHFEKGRRTILAARVERQKELDAGKLPTFLASTASIRSSDYRAAPVVRDLADRRVEITGPVDRKMLINALNSGAKVFMADFEDATSPTWENIVGGQLNVRDAVNRTITYSQGGKSYKLKPEKELATLMVRPRGWHLYDDHITVDGAPISGSLLDFGLYFFHNAKNLIARGSGPYFYLPKMEGHKEARLWNDVFVYSQKRLGIPNGTIRATVLIETILAAYEMDEIIFELRDHSAGLNCGRWDYIFSFIKKFRHHPQYVLPDRALVTMTTPWLANYVKLLIQTCHRRGVHAMGGMAAQIPSHNPEVNNAAFEKVRADKLREVRMGCDGTWVAHPALIPIAQQIFDQHMPKPNQIGFVADKSPVKPQDLLDLGVSGKVTITEDGFRGNISVGLGYLEAWLRGNGCVPLHNLMEDAATAEISRCQIWQWSRHGATLNNGTKVTKQLIEKELANEVNQVKKALGDSYKNRKFVLAAKLYRDMLLNDNLDDFLTLVAYPHIVTKQQQSKL